MKSFFPDIKFSVSGGVDSDGRLFFYFGAHEIAAVHVWRSDGLPGNEKDPFFDPVNSQFTGYAFDGERYVAGVPDGNFASWFLEPPSQMRGALSTFPERVGVVSYYSTTNVDRYAVDLWDFTDLTKPRIWLRFIGSPTNMLCTGILDPAAPDSEGYGTGAYGGMAYGGGSPEIAPGAQGSRTVSAVQFKRGVLAVALRSFSPTVQAAVLLIDFSQDTARYVPVAPADRTRLYGVGALSVLDSGVTDFYGGPFQFSTYVGTGTIAARNDGVSYASETDIGFSGLGIPTLAAGQASFDRISLVIPRANRFAAYGGLAVGYGWQSSAGGDREGVGIMYPYATSRLRVTAFESAFVDKVRSGFNPVWLSERGPIFWSGTRQNISGSGVEPHVILLCHSNALSLAPEAMVYNSDRQLDRGIQLYAHCTDIQGSDGLDYVQSVVFPICLTTYDIPTGDSLCGLLNAKMATVALFEASVLQRFSYPMAVAAFADSLAGVPSADKWQHYDADPTGLFGSGAFWSYGGSGVGIDPTQWVARGEITGEDVNKRMKGLCGQMAIRPGDFKIELNSGFDSYIYNSANPIGYGVTNSFFVTGMFLINMLGQTAFAGLLFFNGAYKHLFIGPSGATKTYDTTPFFAGYKWQLAREGNYLKVKYQDPATAALVNVDWNPVESFAANVRAMVGLYASCYDAAELYADRVLEFRYDNLELLKGALFTSAAKTILTPRGALKRGAWSNEQSDAVNGRFLAAAANRFLAGFRLTDTLA